MLPRIGLPFGPGGLMPDRVFSSTACLLSSSTCVDDVDDKVPNIYSNMIGEESGFDIYDCLVFQHAFQLRFHRTPFAVQNPKPCCIAVTPLDDEVRLLDALEGETHLKR